MSHKRSATHEDRTSNSPEHEPESSRRRHDTPSRTRQDDVPAVTTAFDHMGLQSTAGVPRIGHNRPWEVEQSGYGQAEQDPYGQSQYQYAASQPQYTPQQQQHADQQQSGGPQYSYAYTPAQQGTNPLPRAIEPLRSSRGPPGGIDITPGFLAQFAPQGERDAAVAARRNQASSSSAQPRYDGYAGTQGTSQTQGRDAIQHAVAPQQDLEPGVAGPRVQEQGTQAGPSQPSQTGVGKPYHCLAHNECGTYEAIKYVYPVPARYGRTFETNSILCREHFSHHTTGHRTMHFCTHDGCIRARWPFDVKRTLEQNHDSNSCYFGTVYRCLDDDCVKKKPRTCYKGERNFRIHLDTEHKKPMWKTLGMDFTENEM
jgi:hypothetical protein